MSDDAWRSDVPVSMPKALPPQEVLLDFGTHVFTLGGLKVAMSEAVRAEMVANLAEPIDAGD